MDVDSNDASGPQRCWWLNHTGAGWLVEPAMAAAVTAAGLRGLSVPQTMLNFGIRSADGNGHLQVLYYSDPGQAGISTRASDWARSPWHPTNLAVDRDRADYVAARIDWGKNWAPIVYAYR